MSLLEIVTDPVMGAAVLCGIANPTSAISTTDPNVPMLLRLANQEGRSLSRRHDWQNLVVAHTQTALAAQAQTAFPADFDRLMPYPEIWNRTNNMMYAGPTSPRARQQLLSASITAGSPGWWWIQGNVLQIYPDPTAGDTLAFDYVSKYWVNGMTAASFTADADTADIPEHLICLGVVWRYKKSKGFDYAEDMSTYEREVELRLLARPRRRHAATEQPWR